MQTLNLGILAHVDAGKTTLTERLLYAAGVIDEIGNVDEGSTRTDFLPLERKRGITIKSAVVSFVYGDVTINLIDTPGHPDFIAEVERVLSVLDGAVLVISAVEGVQPQTRILMGALQRLNTPTLVFVRKIDRGGARSDHLLREISENLSLAPVSMGSVRDLGSHRADFTPYGEADIAFGDRLLTTLADHDDAFLAEYVDAETRPSYSKLRDVLAAQTKRALVHPVFFGSAITNAGIAALMDGVVELLPATEGDVGGPASGTVFKVERGPVGEKIAYVRMFSGIVRMRARLRIGAEGEEKVTAIRVFDSGSDVQQTMVAAGRIGKLWGLGGVQIGDTIGESRTTAELHHFAPPTLETVVVPRRPGDKGTLRAALAQLAEQDPLINVRQDDVRQEMFVSLYGEVQKEVIQATLATDFNVDVCFRDSTTICIERPVGTGRAIEVLGVDSNPFVATVGLRIEPGATDSGLDLRLEVELGSLPLAFHKAVEDAVRETLRQGIYGWQVTDCIVTMTDSGYSSVASTAGDFRNLTPLVLMSALRQAGTRVCEPILRFQLDGPADTLGPLLRALAGLHAVPRSTAMRGASCTLEAEIPAARVHDLQQQLPELTHGEGVLEFAFDHYEPVRGTVPTRPRTDQNPLNRKEYLLHVLRRV